MAVWKPPWLARDHGGGEWLYYHGARWLQGREFGAGDPAAGRFVEPIASSRIRGTHRWDKKETPRRGGSTKVIIFYLCFIASGFSAGDTASQKPLLDLQWIISLPPPPPSALHRWHPPSASRARPAWLYRRP